MLKIFKSFFSRQTSSKRKLPSITIKLDGNSDVFVECDFPDPNEETLPERFATLLYVISTGKLLGVIQHSVVLACEDIQHRELGQEILLRLNAILDNGVVGFNPHSPVVSPREVFAIKKGVE